MAVTRITSTRDGTGAINYVLRPKEKDRERVRALSGHALLVDGAPDYHQTTHQQMRHVRDMNNKQGLNPTTNEKYVQAYRVIQSFGENELNPDNEDDVAKCNAMGLELAKELYPDNQSLVVTHSDGIGGNLHNHIVVNAVKFTTGKSLRANETNWHHISKVSDRVLERNGMAPIDKGTAKDLRTQAEVELSERGEYVWKDDLKGRINESIKGDGVTDRDSFKEYMLEEHDVDVRFRGKGMSFAFTDDNDKQRRIRAGRLGSTYQRENVEEMIRTKERVVDDVVVAPKRRVTRPTATSIYGELLEKMNRPDAEKAAEQALIAERANIEAQEVKRLEQVERKAELEKLKADRLKRQAMEKQAQEEKRQQREDLELAERERVRQQYAEDEERRRLERRARFMESVEKNHVKADFDMDHRGNFTNKRMVNHATNTELNEEELQWYNDYKEEKEQALDVGIVAEYDDFDLDF